MREIFGCASLSLSLSLVFSLSKVRCDAPLGGNVQYLLVFISFFVIPIFTEPQRAVPIRIYLLLLFLFFFFLQIWTTPELVIDNLVLLESQLD